MTGEIQWRMLQWSRVHKCGSIHGELYLREPVVVETRACSVTCFKVSFEMANNVAQLEFGHPNLGGRGSCPLRSDEPAPCSDFP